MNDRRAICRKLSNGFNPTVIGAVTVANSEQMRLLGAFLPHHERRNLEEPIVHQSQFCGSRVKTSFYNIINHCLP